MQVCDFIVSAIQCEQGRQYSTCGFECEPSCNDPEGILCSDTATCVEGCFCKDGLVADGDKCIDPTKCGCEENGMYYSVCSLLLVFLKFIIILKKLCNHR